MAFGLLQLETRSSVWLVVVFAAFAMFASCISAWDENCLAFTDSFGKYHSNKSCGLQFCCGSCNNRYCCQDSVRWLSEDKQTNCDFVVRTSVTGTSVTGTIVLLGLNIILFIFLTNYFDLFKRCCRVQPLITTPGVTSPPHSYPQQSTTVPQSYQDGQDPAVQPGYGTQPMPYQEQPYILGPPPSYQEATGPAYSPGPMPYSQAAVTPEQPTYPLQPPAQPAAMPQPNAPPPQMDFQPAFNPHSVPAQPKME